VADRRDPDVQATLALVDFLRENPQLSDRVIMAAVSDHFRSTTHERVLNEASAEIIEVGIDGFDAEAEFDAALRRLRDLRRAARHKELSEKSLAALSPGERDELRQLQAERYQAIGGRTENPKPVIN
jgi:hypothetical protein